MIANKYICTKARDWYMVGRLHTPSLPPLKAAPSQSPEHNTLGRGTKGETGWVARRDQLVGAAQKEEMEEVR